MKTLFFCIFFLIMFIAILLITFFPMLLSILWHWSNFLDVFDDYIEKVYDLTETILLLYKTK